MSELPRFWLTAFWGFTPEHEGYYGFTMEGGRRRFLNEFQDNDLILIYGADVANTAKTDRKQLLGILQVEPTPIRDTDKISEEGLRIKTDLGKVDSWKYAVPVRKAWRIDQRIGVSDLLPDTYTGNNGQSLASFGQLITPAEASRISKLRVTPVNVYGEAPVEQFTPARKMDFREAWSLSRGPSPSFGTRESSYVDGAAYTYVFELQGALDQFLGRTKYELGNRRLIKVGRTNNVERRLKELNSGFPPSSVVRWKLRVQSQPYDDGDSAHEAERRLHELFGVVGQVQGGEFFLCEERQIDVTFAREAKAFRLSA
ncbi:GIY-YIG nuclease family protein [Parerythrobacter aestuarii]|uniref:GIY-YIG nuclease family protein n=1 Tax=Parerythrobacter aestuarii TaxID=3020909 RepID=UPI0024DEB75A|nr:GIY-YIG nuclease family protein [Parerythrobacter aestuarii]